MENLKYKNAQIISKTSTEIFESNLEIFYMKITEKISKTGTKITIF